MYFGLSKSLMMSWLDYITQFEHALTNIITLFCIFNSLISGSWQVLACEWLFFLFTDSFVSITSRKCFCFFICCICIIRDLPFNLQGNNSVHASLTTDKIEHKIGLLELQHQEMPLNIKIFQLMISKKGYNWTRKTITTMHKLT